MNMNDLVQYGTVPPDFHDLTMSSILGSTSAAGMVALSVAMVSAPALAKSVAPYAFTEEFGLHGVEGLAEMAAEAPGVFGMAVVAPLVIAAAALEALTMAIQDMIEIKEARPKLVAWVTAAQKQPVDSPTLQRWLKTPEGTTALAHNWSLITGGASSPSKDQLTTIGGLAQARLDALPKPSPSRNVWTQVQGAASDIGAGGASFMVATGDKKDLLRWGAGAWTKMDGAATRVDASANNNIWAVNDYGQIWQWTGSWKQLNGSAKDVGVGANGQAWVIGTANAAKGGARGNEIYRRKGNAWEKVPGAAVRIDVDPKGNAWVVDSAGRVWEWTGTSFTSRPGNAKDIGIGANGAVWIVGIDGAGYKWNGKGWDFRGGARLRNISVQSDGSPIGVIDDGSIWKSTP
jgi:hypothetical protein